MNMLKQIFSFLSFFVEVKTAFEPRWSIFHLIFCLLDDYQLDHGKWHGGLLLLKDGLIFSSTVFIVVSVYQQKITPLDEI